MVWTAFIKHLKTDIFLISGRIDAAKYQNLLRFIAIKEDTYIIFKQDKNLAQKSRTANAWFEKRP